ncbi:hypothetical protein [Pinirhizobacter soli]|uniref:hypothetical protein n=1 Tax=Pinirhizobacter soli TaxID=2786953 RepID=UPI00202A21ED|nr:hypothetical protein [Pinirhizobacter soli]
MNFPPFPEFVFFVAPPSAAATEWWVPLVQLASPLGALIIFFLGTWFANWQSERTRARDDERTRAEYEDNRQRDRDAFEQAKARDRDTRRLDMKRDALLKAAPAIASAYLVLGKLGDDNIPDNAIKSAFARAQRPVALLQVVASDETLAAAARLMTEVGLWYVRLYFLRLRAQTENISPATRLSEFVAAAENVAPLWADFLALARAELDLEFDRDAFLNSILKANREQIALGNSIIKGLGATNN